MTTNNYFKIPNKFILDYNSFDLEIISQLCKRKSLNGFWEGHVNGLLYFSNIPIDRNYNNKKRTLQLLRSLGANIDKDYISIFIDSLFDTNESDIHINYTLIPFESYDLINDRNLFKYYLFLLYGISIGSGCYKNSLEIISDKVGFSTTTIIKYNKLLMDYGLVYYINSGDLYSKSNNTVISSINFYSLSMDICSSELDRWLLVNKENYNITTFEKNTDKYNSSWASSIIRWNANKSNLSKDKFNDLMKAYEIKLQSIKVDYTNSKVKEGKILALIDRTKGGDYELTFDEATMIINGELKIRECFKGDID